MSIVIDNKLSVPVTEEQILAFKTWAIEKYGDYTTYSTAVRNDNSIDIYVRSNILTQDMKSMWIESEPYINIRSDDLRVKRIKLYRKRIINKVRYMKIHLGDLTFEDEVHEMLRLRRENMRLTIESQRETYTRIINDEIARFRTEEEYRRILNMATPYTNENKYTETKSIKPKPVSNELFNSIMTDDCSICMEKHIISQSCQTPCGHIFGSTCLRNWKYDSCPLCRSVCTFIYEFVEEDNNANDNDNDN